MSLIIGIGTRIGRRVNKALNKWHTVVSQMRAMFLYRIAGGADNDDLPESNGRAVINTIYGNTVKWNQMVPIPDTDKSIDGSGVTITDNRDGSYTIFTVDTGTTTVKFIKLIDGSSEKFIVDHKYFVTGVNGDSTTYYLINKYSTNSGFGRCYYPLVFTALKSTIDISLQVANGAIITTPVTVKPQVIDLTALEYPNIASTTPTVEEVEAWLALNVGEQDYYPYDEGSLISFKGTGIKSVGFNKWDEQWENGSLSATTGANTPDPQKIRSKNYIPVTPNTRYYFCCLASASSTYAVCCYDKNKNVIPGTAQGGYSYVGAKTTYLTPTNCYYMRFRMPTAYGNTYNNNLCINISNPAKNGTYEPYWSDEKPFDVKKVYGMTGGSSTLVQVYPDGMFGAVTGWTGPDKMGYLWGTKPVAEVSTRKIDLGNCLWSLVSGCDHTFETSIDIEAAEAIDYTYSETIDETDTTQDKLIGPTNGFHLTILDRSLSSTDLVDGHIAALEGVYVLIALYAGAVGYYNLVYRDNGTDTPLEEIFPIKYKVDKYSTEEVLVPTGDAPTSTSMIADIEYQAR